MEKVYEIWYKFYDGTQADTNGGNEKIKTFKDKENAMLKNTIARNEAHIERMQHKGEWKK